MKNSYDEAATDGIPTHLFEWAVGDEPSAPDVATKVVLESASRQLEKIRAEDKQAKVLNEMADFGVAAVEALEDVGFEADFAILPEGKIKVSFDDVDHVFDRKRRRLASSVIGKLAEVAEGDVTDSYLPEHMSGGDITVGLLGGIGFGPIDTGVDPNLIGINPNFNPFDAKNVSLVHEMDVNVDDDVLERIDELTTMWDGDYETYREGAELTLREMDAKQRDSLASWIETQTRRIGVAGSTLEEVLHDVYRRIRKMRER